MTPRGKGGSFSSYVLEAGNASTLQAVIFLALHD